MLEDSASPCQNTSAIEHLEKAVVSITIHSCLASCAKYGTNQPRTSCLPDCESMTGLLYSDRPRAPLGTLRQLLSYVLYSLPYMEGTHTVLSGCPWILAM